MNKLKLALAGLLVVPMVATAVVPANSVEAQQPTLKNGVSAARGDGSADKFQDPNSLVQKVVNIILYLVGILSVIMLIWGGIRYTTSAGDSNKVTSAKNTIIYAVIGLVVAVFAYALVNYVLVSLGSSAAN